MDTVTRFWTAVLLASLGVAALLKPEVFFGVKTVFVSTLRRLSGSQRERLERVLVRSSRFSRFAVALFACIAVINVPQLHVTGVFLLLAAAIMLVLAYRVAIAPARLLGEDPEVESIVDDRIRFFRANGIAVFAGLAFR